MEKSIKIYKPKINKITPVPKNFVFLLEVIIKIIPKPIKIIFIKNCNLGTLMPKMKKIPDRINIIPVIPNHVSLIFIFSH